MSRMLLERISQAGIARVLQVSEDTVQRYVNSQATAVKKQVSRTPKEKKRLNVQMDELWSFVDSKGNQQWVWLALDAETREIVGVHIGDRSAASPSSFMGFNTTSVPSICSNLYRPRFVLMILYYPANVIKPCR
jgi:insertion element IS1 protein InsB